MMKPGHSSLNLRWNAIGGQILIAAACLLTPVLGHTAADEEAGRIKALMHTLVLEYAKLSPYLVSEEAFNTPKAKETVKESLTNLEAKVQRAPPAELKASPGFRISYALLADHVRKTKEVFDRGEMEYTRMRLNGIGNLCAGCHLQVPKISHFSAFEFVTERSQKPSYENAGFLFTIRRYDEAEQMFDGLIRRFPQSEISGDQLNDVYRHKLAILARVYRDPVKARQSLTEDLKNEKLPADVRANVKSWLETLAEWEKDKTDPAKMKTPELIAYVDKNMPSDMSRRIAPSDPQLLNLLRLSGVLYERLYTETNPANVQALLYDLARCERSLAPHYWYSMNEIYLKECIMRFPKQSYSKKCYNAYESGMQERYFGKPLPEGVQQSLRALKDYL